jgi:nucleoid-associated protein YgaU
MDLDRSSPFQYGWEKSMGILETLGLKKKAVAPATGHTIKVGPRETLKSISMREYGSEEHWTKIYEANKWRIDGDEVAVGQDLMIPDLQTK